MARCKCSLDNVGERFKSSSARVIAGAQWRRLLACTARKFAQSSLLAVLISSARPVAFGGDAVRTSIPELQAAEIPIKLYQGYLIVVEGRVGNLDHQHLVLDTGTNPSMIDAKVSAKLGLQSSTRSLALLNKNVASASVILPDLQFGPLRRQNLQVMVADFSRISSGLGTSIDAVIGLDVLGATSFTVDYANRRMFFRASMEPHTAPFTAGRQFITVNLKSGGRQLNLLFDTGTPRLVLFENNLGGVDYLRSDATGRGENVSGDVTYKTIVLQQARIGTQEVGPQRAAVVANRKEMESDWDGLIGVSCLRPKRLSFDFERHILGWSD
jgi:predicted aspartyl protease